MKEGSLFLLEMINEKLQIIFERFFMKKKFTLITYLLLILFIKNLSAQTILFEDKFDGDNTVSGLTARGWTILDADGGGTQPAWFQGNPAVFAAKEGPTNGYVGSNFQGANNSDEIDHWLISPTFNLTAGDSLHFWARTASGIFDDSISVYFSLTPNPTTSDFLRITGFTKTVLDTNWTLFSIHIFAANDFQFAIRYNMFNASSTADYIGIDEFQVYSKVLPYPSSITLSNTFTFNDATQSSSYRMIGLPGNETTKISDMISGTQKKDWNAFYDNGASTNFLKEFDGSSTFNFAPGKGFWILSKNQFNTNATVQTVTLLTDNTFSISLHSGFNIISNPFENSVSWADVQNLNGLVANDFLFDWSGVWTHAAQMQPYKGYYFINTNNLTSLKIPYSFTVAKISKSNPILEENYGDSYIKLSLLENNHEKSYIVAGFNSKAVNDYDKLDNFAPPGNFDQVRIHIDDNNLTTNYKQLFVDYRPAINDGQTFNLEIKNTTDEAVNLIASGLENFANEEVYLFDINVNKFYNLKDENKISISTLHDSRNYQLLIGNENYINNIKKSAVPISYSLDQNYPNPFNPTTIIRYQITTDGLVQLKIYNILGKEIKTLVNKEQQQGLYEVELNASDLSSGVYFYCLKAGSFSSTKKMIVLK
jgi:Secretion system C-terminal sorting domain